MTNRHPRNPEPRPKNDVPNNLDDTDLVWNFKINSTGEIVGEIDPDEILAKHGHDPQTPLDLLLLRIIDAHGPQNARDRNFRLARARAAIEGKTLKRGPKKKISYDLLIEIAKRYVKEFYETKMNIIPIRPLIDAILQDPEWSHLVPKTVLGRVNFIEYIAKYFTKEQELLLVRATSLMNWDRMDRHRALRKIAEELAQLGMRIDTAARPPSYFA